MYVKFERPISKFMYYRNVYFVYACSLIFFMFFLMFYISQHLFNNPCSSFQIKEVNLKTKLKTPPRLVIIKNERGTYTTAVL